MTKKSDRASESSAETARKDAMFDVLADSRRRFSLQHLRGADTPVKVSDLTAEIEAWEGRGSVAGRPGGDPDDIEIALVHNHLPKMAAAGLVEYDAARGTVALTDTSA